MKTVVKEYSVDWTGLDENWEPSCNNSFKVKTLKEARNFRKMIMQTYKAITYCCIVKTKTITKFMKTPR